jgi:hypothetical protein
MASGTALKLERSMLENERPLLIAVTADAGLVSADRKPGLFLFKAAVRIMAIAARHRALKHFVPERF